MESFGVESWNSFSFQKIFHAKLIFGEQRIVIPLCKDENQILKFHFNFFQICFGGILIYIFPNANNVKNVKKNQKLKVDWKKTNKTKGIFSLLGNESWNFCSLKHFHRFIWFYFAFMKLMNQVLRCADWLLMCSTKLQEQQKCNFLQNSNTVNDSILTFLSVIISVVLKADKAHKTLSFMH